LSANDTSTSSFPSHPQQTGALGGEIPAKGKASYIDEEEEEEKRKQASSLALQSGRREDGEEGKAQGRKRDNRMFIRRKSTP